MVSALRYFATGTMVIRYTSWCLHLRVLAQTELRAVRVCAHLRIRIVASQNFCDKSKFQLTFTRAAPRSARELASGTQSSPDIFSMDGAPTAAMHRDGKIACADLRVHGAPWPPFQCQIATTATCDAYAHRAVYMHAAISTDCAHRCLLSVTGRHTTARELIRERSRLSLHSPSTSRQHRPRIYSPRYAAAVATYFPRSVHVVDVTAAAIETVRDGPLNALANLQLRQSPLALLTGRKPWSEGAPS